MSEATDEDVIITGCQELSYPADKVHRAGYAVDIRTSNRSDPNTDKQILENILGEHYVVLYGDSEHQDHMHIGFAFWFSEEYKKHGKIDFVVDEILVL